ncbi:hypothetical protein ACFL6E_07670 [Candidatus Neomarinimicrobiota bacterium]
MSESLIPLALGNEWVYQAHYYSENYPEWNVTDTNVVMVLDSVDVTIKNKAVTAYSMQGFYDIPPLGHGAHWLLADEPEGLYLIGGLADDTLIQNKTLLIKYPYYASSKWSDSALFYNYGIYGSVFFTQGITETACISTNAKVSTSAGDFTCVVFKFSRDTVIDAGSEVEFYDYYAVGVGLVRRELKDDGFLTIQSDLISYDLQ